MVDTSLVTRLEIIDHTDCTYCAGTGRIYNINDSNRYIECGACAGSGIPGRVAVFWRENQKISLSLQDEGRTLKVFISKRNNETGMLITKNVEQAVKHRLEEILYAGASGQSGDMPNNDPVEIGVKEIMSLIRIEAINLADKIIGKNMVVRNAISSHGELYVNPIDKAVHDFQAAQRAKLAKYQNKERII